MRALALLVIAVLASVAFLVIAAELRGGALDRLDIEVELAVHRLDSTVADVPLQTATLIGTNWVLLPVVAAVAALALHRRRRAVAIVLVADAAVVIAANLLLKLMFARDRPRLFDKVALPTDYSFPSGHAMSAVGIYGVVAAALIALYPAARTPLIVAAVVLAAAIGFSRIYLGVHWPFDVLAGFLGGVPPLVVSVHLLHSRHADRDL